MTQGQTLDALKAAEDQILDGIVLTTQLLEDHFAQVCVETQ